MPVRSIGHDRERGYVFYGTMDGTLYGWNHESKEESQYLDNLEHAITCIRTMSIIIYAEPINRDGEWPELCNGFNYEWDSEHL